MRTIFLILLTILIPIGLIAQDFAPIGAKWYYTEKYFMSGDIGFLTAESIKDTIIKSKDCRQILNGTLCGAYDSGTNYIYEEDSTVFFYCAAIDSFQILYNFKAKKGDSWTIIFNAMGELDTIKATIDSIFNVNINGHLLIRQLIKYTNPNDNQFDNWYYYGEVTERIGDSYFLFNLYSSSIICDGNWSEGLRCYEDSELGFYSTGIADSCTYTYKWTSIENHINGKNIEIYPNPTTGQFQVEIDSEMKTTLEIINLMGKVIYSKDFISRTQIDLSGLSNGIYILSLKYQDEVIGMEKILKK